MPKAAQSVAMFERRGPLIALGSLRPHVIDSRTVTLVVCSNCSKGRFISTSAFASGRGASCSCSMVKDIKGERFGKLVAVERVKTPKGKPGSHWKFHCDCGEEIIRAGAKVSHESGARSCGKCVSTKFKVRHGLSRSVHAITLASMIDRCHNPNARFYPHYGGRGIYVCDRWRFGEGGRAGVELFAEDMGPRPDKHSIDRIDVNRGYEPSNCRWASKVTQANTKRCTVWVKVSGRKMTLANAARTFKVPYAKLLYQIRKRGRSPEEALRRLGVRMPVTAFDAAE